MSPRIKYTIDGEEVWRYQWELGDVCQSVHCHHSGASDPVDDSELSQSVEWLKLRLEDWHPNQGRRGAYDNAWRELVKATLAEHACYQAQAKDTPPEQKPKAP